MSERGEHMDWRTQRTRSTLSHRPGGRRGWSLSVIDGVKVRNERDAVEDQERMVRR